MKEIAKAIVAMQADLAKITIKRDTKAFNYKYAQLDQVIDETRSILCKNGLAIIQAPFNDGSVVGIKTTLIHDSGECIESSFGSTPMKSDPQSIGSLITYYRRYSWLALLGLAPEDDDGQSAMPNQNSQIAPQPRTIAQAPKSNAQPISDKEILRKKLYAITKSKHIPISVVGEYLMANFQVKDMYSSTPEALTAAINYFNGVPNA